MTADMKPSCALISRRALYPRSPCLFRVATTRRTWTQTRRACATCAPTADEVKPRSAGTLCLPFCPSRSCKRTPCSNAFHFKFLKPHLTPNVTAAARTGSQFCSLSTRVRDNNRVFKSSPHARQMKNSSVMTPPPIHINGKGNREVSTFLIGSNCSGSFGFCSYP